MKNKSEPQASSRKGEEMRENKYWVATVNKRDEYRYKSECVRKQIYDLLHIRNTRQSYLHTPKWLA